MKIINKKIMYSVFFLLLLMCGSSFGMLFSSPIVIQDSGNFSTPKSSAGEITIVTPENITYIEPDNGYYPATFGFENEVDGTSRTDIAYVDSTNNIQSNCFVDIVNNFQGHNKVLRIYDQNTAGNAEARNHFTSPQVSGTIEWWWSTSVSGANMIDILFYEGTLGTGVGKLKMEDGNYLDMQDSIVQSYTANQWYYHVLEFDAVSDTYNWSIDGVLRVSNGSFLTPVDNIGTMNTNADWANYGICYVDAVGYSWDPNYNIGDNLNEGLLLSYENNTNLDWKGYSLDGEANKTIIGNTTISMPLDGAHTIQVFGNDSMGVMHESQTNHFSVHHINLATPEAKVYTEPDLGYFPATDGFEHVQNSEIPEDWDIYYGSGCNIEVQNSLDGHQKILQFYDNSQSLVTKENCAAYKYIENLPYGTVELWIRTSDSSKELQVRFLNDPTYIFHFQIQDNKFQYWEDSYHDIGLDAYSNEWYHIRVDFEATTGNYSGLSQWKWQIYINNILYGPYNYTANLVVNRLQLNTGSLEYGYSTYFDAFGYTSDPNYIIGDNFNEGLLLSYDNSTTLDWKGYSLDSQANRTILGNTTITMPSDGVHNIQVFGNDTMGTMYNSAIRYFTVNTAPPDITINSPTDSQIIGSTAPIYDITIVGSYDNIWYALEGGANYTTSGLTGTIDQSAWSALPDGIITIDFYANNSAGMERHAQVMVIKQTSSEPPPGIPGYNLYLLLGAIAVISTLIIRKRLKS